MSDSQEIDGWVVCFRRNIHMYAHSLKLSRGAETYEVGCEDTPDGFVAIWPYELPVDGARLQEIVSVLRKWASAVGLRGRLYTSKSTHEMVGSTEAWKT
jgi:hypothetical protein